MADPIPNPNPNSRVSSDTVARAVRSLLKWRASKSAGEKPQLLDQDEFFYVTLSLKKIPAKDRVNSFNIPLPHPLFDAAAASPELCLIVDDRPSSGLTKDAAAKKIAADSIPISKVIKLTKLRSDYKAFEAKRRLCDSFDVFLADKRAVPLLPKALGKEFFRRRKIPVPVDLRKGNWAGQVARACGSARLFVRTGTCCVVRAARASMSAEDVAENIAAVIEGAAAVVPGKWRNVRSFHVKLLESVALPLYQALPESRMRIDAGIEAEKPAPSPAPAPATGTMMVKARKKKGRIHEVKYMDAEDDDDNVGPGEEVGEMKKVKRKKRGESGVAAAAGKPKKVKKSS